MLVVVVALIVVMVLVHSLFLLMVKLLGLIGLEVLLYHCTHYACRGGASGNSIFCGSCLCDLNDTDYHTRWYIGAALCVHIILFVVVFLTVMHFGVYFLLVLTILLLLLVGVMVLLGYKKIKDWYYFNPLFIFILLDLLIYCPSLFLI